MFLSEQFGRAFWLDDDNEFRSCPLKLNNIPDLDHIDYVSEWTDLEGLELGKLLNIHKIVLHNRIHSKSLVTFNDFDLSENVYNEVKKCYNSSNPEEVI